MSRYGIRITEDNLNLITFLNDGVRPPMDEKTIFICEISEPHEITSKIVTEDELAGQSIQDLL